MASMWRFLALLLFAAPAALAQGTLEVIPRRHRTADARSARDEPKVEEVGN